MVAAMDVELLKICSPPHTEMRDYSQSPSADLGAGVFWSLPELSNDPGDAPITKQQWNASAARVARYAQMKVYFFPSEVAS
jgi:hypothetical protein